jgi:serine protease AprX
MVRIIFLCFAFLLSNQAFSQAKYQKYYIQLRDKKPSKFSVLQPQDFLSAAALNRRAQARIRIDSTDLPVSAAYISQIAANCKQVMVVTKWLNGLGILADSSQIAAIKALPFVTSATYLGPWYGFRFPTNAPPKTRLTQDTLPVAYNGFETVFEGFASVQQAPMQAQMLRSLFGAAGQGKQVAIMDGGFTQIDASPFFRHLDDRGAILSTRDFVEGDKGVYEASFHGSTVFSVMAAYAPYYFTSAATEAQYHLLITEDTNGEFPMEELNWIAGAEYADSIGVDVINASLGYTSFNDTTMNHTYTDLDGRTALGSKGAAIAAKKGMVICNSAGNSGNEEWKYIGVPSDAVGIVSVGATSREGKHADFSSFGPSADGRIKPDLVAPGHMVVGMANDGIGITFTSGTSFASPILAANITALWSGFPEMTANEVMEAVYATSSQSFVPDTVLGYGLPDFAMAYLNLLGASNKSTKSLFSMQPIHTTVEMQEVLMSHSPKEGQVIGMRLTDALGQIFEYSFHENGYETNSLDQVKTAQVFQYQEVLHFLKWPKSQCALGLVKCHLIFAEGGGITKYLINR